MPVEQITQVDNFKTFISPTKYSKVTVKKIGTITAQVEGVYPFRVRFRSLEFPGISSGNAPAIGLAVIGSTFLIL